MAAEFGATASSPASQPRKGASSSGRRASRFRGVTYHSRTGRFEAHLWNRSQQIYLGGFLCETQAALAYDIAAVSLKGGAALTNFDLGSELAQELATFDAHAAMLQQLGDKAGAPEMPVLFWQVVAHLRDQSKQQSRMAKEATKLPREHWEEEVWALLHASDSLPRISEGTQAAGRAGAAQGNIARIPCAAAAAPAAASLAGGTAPQLAGSLPAELPAELLEQLLSSPVDSPASGAGAGAEAAELDLSWMTPIASNAVLPLPRLPCIACPKEAAAGSSTGSRAPVGRKLSVTPRAVERPPKRSRLSGGAAAEPAAATPFFL